MIIGLHGAAGAGKDTVADFLVADGFRKYALAWPMKLALCTMFGWDPDQWEDREWKERVIPWIGKSPRQLSQTLGTDWGRLIVDDDLWLDMCEVRILQACRDKADIVISDVRFDNEAEMIFDNGGVIVNVISDMVKPVNKHVSEQGINPDLIAYDILNNGPFDGSTLEGLIDQVDAIVEKERGTYADDTGRAVLATGS